MAKDSKPQSRGMNKPPFDDDLDPVTVKIMLLLGRLGVDWIAEKAPDGTTTITYNADGSDMAMVNSSPPTKNKTMKEAQ